MKFPCRRGRRPRPHQNLECITQRGYFRIDDGEFRASRQCHCCWRRGRRTGWSTFHQASPAAPQSARAGKQRGQDTFDLPHLYAFDEDQNILLKTSLEAEVGRNPVPAGSTVASHYVFFDPGPAQEIIGTVDFDSRIVAIMTSTGTMAASDFLAKTGVNYLNPSARGLESGDYVTISGPKRILFHTVASRPGDYVRVLTEFSPGAPQRITSTTPDQMFASLEMLNCERAATAADRDHSSSGSCPGNCHDPGFQEHHEPCIDPRRALGKPA